MSSMLGAVLQGACTARCTWMQRSRGYVIGRGESADRVRARDVRSGWAAEVRANGSRHRHGDTHDCAGDGAPGVDTKGEAQALLNKLFPNVKSGPSTSRAVRPSDTAKLRAIELMRLKHKAVAGDPGRTQTRPGDRVHLRVVAGEKERGVVTGRAVDLAAKALGVSREDGRGKRKAIEAIAREQAEMGKAYLCDGDRAEHRQRQTGAVCGGFQRGSGSASQWPGGADRSAGSGFVSRASGSCGFRECGMQAVWLVITPRASPIDVEISASGAMPSRTSLSPPSLSLSLSPPLQYPLEMPYYEAPLAGQLVAAVRPKRKQVKNACSACQRACKRCDVGRPCERCIKYGMADSCRDSQRKERKKGVKRGPYKKRDEAGSSDGKRRLSDVPTVMSQDVQAVPVELHSVPSLRPPDGPFPYSTAVMVAPPVASHFDGDQFYRYDLSRYREDYRQRIDPPDHSPPRDRQYSAYDRVQDYAEPHDETPSVRDYSYPQRSYPDHDQYYYNAYSSTYPSYNYQPVSQPVQQQQSDAPYHHHLGRMLPDHYASTPSSINPYSAQPQMSTPLHYSPMRSPAKLAHRDSIDPSPSIVHHHQHHPQHVGNVQIQSN
ncbi:hypothetical protein CTheo_913 [Ceratobasidium theobromae]|uniref:Zn(2)-C6 fungal-type domain-containing protein n=1 Tax=Ceratobasidium theobromae TaxID=1582974 RepID=A0A5N5QV83_9AGAM|nr:hypothetical protein CTheo_913 [Ceratobasidium theobromae]